MEFKNIRYFGTTIYNEIVSAITLKNSFLSCEILTYGATIRSLYVPDQNEHPVDVVLGYDTLQEYEQNDGYLGATVGRFANRIADGRFSLNGTTYSLFQNNGNNHLHGGAVGFSHRVWNIAACSDSEVILSLTSPDGEEGYPGNMKVLVTFTLHDRTLSIQYHAVCDTDTICNLTNHSYFNLAGHNSGKTYDQEILLHATHYTPTDGDSIPFGVVSPVYHTPMDLTRYTKIGTHLNEHFPQIIQARGYDHNYVIDGPFGVLRPAARVKCQTTGITLQVDTTLPGMQFYTANYLEDSRRGKGACTYGPQHGFCLETQFFPDAPNQPAFPSPILRAGETFKHTTTFSFSIE